jgi:hypothetical protein
VLHHIAAHVARGTRLTTDELRALDRIRPVASGWPYQPDYADPLLFDGHFSFAGAREVCGDLPAVFLDLTWRRPLVTLRHFVWSTTYLWRVRDGRGDRMWGPVISLGPADEVTTMDRRFSPERWGFGPQSQLPRFERRVAEWICYSFDSRRTNWLLWRPALWLYLGVAAALVAVLRARTGAYLLVIVPVLLNALGVAGFGCGQIFRYQYATNLVVPLVAGFLFVGVPLGRRNRDRLADDPVLLPGAPLPPELGPDETQDAVQEYGPDRAAARVDAGMPGHFRP